jgi:iron complex transport system substrate-binding protein
LVRRAILVLVLLASIASSGLLTACNKESSHFTVTDDLGREIYIEETPEAVVSLAPSITEILFRLDLGEKVVGVTAHCDYPEDAKDKPQVGGYFSTSLESILDQTPDLILADGYDPVIEEIKELGIPLLVLQPTDISGIFKDIKLIGQVMNEEKDAAKLVDSLQQRLDTVAGNTANAADRPTVFYEIDASDQTKPWTVGPGSFADALITLAGGQNVLKEGAAYRQINLESLLSADPDIVILGDYPYVTPEQVMARTGVWQGLPAVKDGRVRAISNPDLTSRPGPRIIDGLEEMARIIHPELFAG